MIDWTLVSFGIVVGALVMVVAWFATVWKDRRGGLAEYQVGEHDELEVSALRNVHGVSVFEVTDLSPIDFETNIEICISKEDSYTRILMDFPTTLLQNLKLMKENEELIRRFLQRREVEIGDAAFDDRFLVLTENTEYLREIVDPELSESMVSLADRVDEMKVDPSGVFFQSYIAVESGELRVLLDLAHQVMKNYYRRARAIEERELAGVDDNKVFDESEGHLGLYGRR